MLLWILKPRTLQVEANVPHKRAFYNLWSEDGAMLLRNFDIFMAKDRNYISLECRHLPTSLRGVKAKKEYHHPYCYGNFKPQVSIRFQCLKARLSGKCLHLRGTNNSKWEMVYAQPTL